MNFEMEEKPSFKENKQKKIVEYGDKNNYPQYLVELFTDCGIHSAILKTRQNLIYGSGIDKVNKKTLNFISTINSQGETLEDVIKKVVIDYTIFQGFALQIIWNKKGDAISEIIHQDFSKVRSGIKNDMGIVESYYLADEWCTYTNKKAIEVPAFSTKDNKNKTQLYYVFDYMPGAKYYPMPMYSGAINYIELSRKISKFHLSNVENGMTPSLAVTLQAPNASEEERQDILRDLKNNFVGSDNAGKFIVNIVDNIEEKPVIDVIDSNNNHLMFADLNKSVVNNILSTHQISPILANVTQDGFSIGTSEDILNAHAVYFNNVIVKDQETILIKINKLLFINGLEQISIINNKPTTNYFSENLLKEILTLNELREQVGYSEVPTGDTINGLPIIETADQTIQNDTTSTDNENNPIA